MKVTIIPGPNHKEQMNKAYTYIGKKFLQEKKKPQKKQPKPGA